MAWSTTRTGLSTLTHLTDSQRMADTDPSATLAELSTSLTALEQALDPLLATPLQQHLEHSAAADSPLTQARAHILASYVVHDLVWGQSAQSLPESAPGPETEPVPLAVYLKAAGIEPASHPVMQELVRFATVVRPHGMPAD